MNGNGASTQFGAEGKPCIAGRRITVQNVVIWHERLGLSADEIASEHDLSLSDGYAALTYYDDYGGAIDQAIHADEAFVDDLCRRTASKLAAKRRGHGRYLTDSLAG